MRQAYPTLAWLRSALRNNLVAPVRRPILAAYVVGSEAKGTARPDSDLDIAVVIPRVQGKTALQITEEWHSRFSSQQFWPHWNGRPVDVQFFYEDDPELAGYDKIPLD